MNDKTLIMPQSWDTAIRKFLQRVAVPVTVGTVFAATGWVIWVSLSTSQYESNSAAIDKIAQRTTDVETELKTTQALMRQGFINVEASIERNNSLLIRVLFREESQVDGED